MFGDRTVIKVFNNKSVQGLALLTWVIASSAVAGHLINRHDQCVRERFGLERPTTDIAERRRQVAALSPYHPLHDKYMGDLISLEDEAIQWKQASERCTPPILRSLMLQN